MLSKILLTISDTDTGGYLEQLDFHFLFVQWIYFSIAQTGWKNFSSNNPNKSGSDRMLMDIIKYFFAKKIINLPKNWSI